jgi:hypothetical protein
MHIACCGKELWQLLATEHIHKLERASRSLACCGAERSRVLRATEKPSGAKEVRTSSDSALRMSTNVQKRIKRCF